MKRKKRRKPKQERNRTVSRKRKKQLQEAQSKRRRTRFARRRSKTLGTEQMINTAFIRKKAVRFYRGLKSEGRRERDAAQQTALKWQVSCSTRSRWDPRDRKHGWRGLLDQSKRPLTIHYQIHPELKLWEGDLRTLLGWGERRISAELESRQIGKISHTSCNRIFREYHLPVTTYHPKGESDGLQEAIPTPSGRGTVASRFQGAADKAEIDAPGIDFCLIARKWAESLAVNHS